MTLMTPPATAQEISTKQVSRQIEFGRIFSTDFTNAYFNRPELEVCKFDFQPSAATQKMVANMGLIYRPRVAGLNLGMALEHRVGLIKWLRGGASTERDWRDNHLQEWMSFTCRPLDTDFGNYTGLSPAFDANKESLFFSNAETHRRTSTQAERTMPICAQAVSSAWRKLCAKLVRWSNASTPMAARQSKFSTSLRRLCCVILGSSRSGCLMSYHLNKSPVRWSKSISEHTRLNHSSNAIPALSGSRAYRLSVTTP